MANHEQLGILAGGAEVWNGWRRTNPGVRPDLRDASLIGVNLRNFNLGGSAVNPNGDPNSCDAFSSARSISVQGPQRVGKSALVAAIREEILQQYVIPSVSADLYHADLTGADLSYADLTNADLTWAHLNKANLTNACLEGAYLWFSEFYETELTGANLDGATIGWTKFACTNLAVANGLETTKHVGPSSIGIDTIIRSGDRISHEFLKRAGVPDSVIGSLNLFGERDKLFHSCFISYSSRDQVFAERLYTHLQSKGVRCWFAPQDLKIGNKFRAHIHESIRLYDKLLVILSENSIQSPWVEDEVEAAFARERQEHCEILFPIRLDDVAREARQGWIESLRQMRHIGDFSQWRDIRHYEEAFNRLLRDLMVKSTP